MERARSSFRRIVTAVHLLGQGRCLACIGDRRAEQSLENSRTLFHRMGATPRIAECDRLIAAARTATS